MDVTVLRNSSRYTVPLGVGSAWLVEDGGTRILVDAAVGADAALDARTGGLDALLLTHHHEEMVADVLPVLRSRRPPAFLVPEAGAGAYAGRPEVAASRVVPVGPGFERGVGALRLRFGPLDHGCPGVSVRVEGPTGVLALTGETALVAGLADLAKGADLLAAPTHRLHARGPHRTLSAREAGTLAREAGARRLALVHPPFYPEVEASLAEARAAFAGDVVPLRESSTLRF